MMHIDDVLEAVGEFGLYQRVRYAIVACVSVWCSLQIFSMIFLASKTDFQCHVPDGNEGHTFNSSLATAVLSTGTPCKMYDWEGAVRIYNSSHYDNESDFRQMVSRLETRKCPYGYDYYNTSLHRTTIVSEFDLVCEHAPLRSTAKSLFFAGKLIGTPLSGSLADRFGRRRVFIACVLMATVFGIIAAAATNSYVFYAFYTLAGAADPYSVAFTIVTEMVGRQYRMATGFCLHMSFSFGCIVLGGLAYLIRDWRYLMYSITLPGLIISLSYFVLDESLRWSLSRNRDEEAERTLNKISRINRRALPENLVYQLKEQLTKEKELHQHVETRTLLDVFRHGSIAMITLKMWYCWCVVGMVYFGMSLNAGNLGGSMYINIAVIGLFEIPGYSFFLYIINKIGRKKSLASAFIMSGIFCCASGLSSDIEWLCIAFSVIGKFFSCGIFGSIFLYTAELFPTEIRNTVISSSFAVSRVGSVLAPFVIELGDIWKPIPLIVFGGLALIGGLFAMFMPETKGRPLLQTIDEMLKDDIFHNKKLAMERQTIYIGDVGKPELERNGIEKKQLI